MQPVDCMLHVVWLVQPADTNTAGINIALQVGWLSRLAQMLHVVWLVQPVADT